MKTKENKKINNIVYMGMGEPFYNFENIVISKDEQLFTSEKLSKDLEEALKRQKRQTTIFKIGTGVGAVATLLLLIQ